MQVTSTIRVSNIRPVNFVGARVRQPSGSPSGPIKGEFSRYAICRKIDAGAGRACAVYVKGTTSLHNNLNY